MSLNDKFSSLVAQSILQPIAEWLIDTKGLTVSVDELNSVINVNTKSSIVPKLTKTTSLPSTKKSSPKTSTTPCKHIMTRQPRKGEPCNQPSVAGSEYCRRHIKQYEGTTTTTTANKSAGAFSVANISSLITTPKNPLVTPSLLASKSMLQPNIAQKLTNITKPKDDDDDDDDVEDDDDIDDDDY